MRRITAFILVLATLFSLTACGKISTFSPSPTPTPEPTPAPTPQPTPEPTPEPTPLNGDYDPPEITLLPMRVFYVGKPPAYFSIINATDNMDTEEQLEFAIDKSNVDPNTPGEYEVTYTVTDRAGNSTSVTTTLIFKEDDSDHMAELDQAAQNIIDWRTRPEWSDERKAFAVFEYLSESITYNHDYEPTRDDWHNEAYNGLVNHSGNCLAFYGAYRYILEKMGIPVLTAERKRISEDETRHVWCLVNLGTGWYHVDATTYRDHSCKVFMYTTEELYAISEDYWRIDDSLYTDLGHQPYDFIEEDIWSNITFFKRYPWTNSQMPHPFYAENSNYGAFRG